jgi:hypothetical protein
VFTFGQKLFLFLFVTGCSWTGRDFFKFSDKETHSDQVIKQFDLDPDLLDKFTTQEATKAKITPKQKQVNKKDAKTLPQTKPKKTLKQSLVKVEEPRELKTVDPSLVKATSPEESKNQKVPEDYPELYQEYDAKSKRTWELFKPKLIVGEQMIMDIGYAGMTVGSIALSVKPYNMIAGREVFHFFAKLKSAPFYKLVYTLDDVVESFVDKESFLPIKYSLIQRESKQSIDDIQLFDRDALKTYFRMSKTKKGKNEKVSQDAFIPYFSQDALSLLFFLRGLPLKVNDVYNIPLVVRGKVSVMNARVEKIETITTPIGERSAYRISAYTHYSGDLVKKGQMTYWISNDEQRVFLQFNADIKLGSVRGLIQSYQVIK